MYTYYLLQVQAQNKFQCSCVWQIQILNLTMRNQSSRFHHQINLSEQSHFRDFTIFFHLSERGASAPNNLFVYSRGLSLVLSLCGLYPNRGYLRLRPGPLPLGYSCIVTWSADASKSSMLTAINLTRRVNTHGPTHSNTHTHRHTNTGCTPGDRGKRKKLKSCTALHAFSPVHGKFPSSNLRWEQKSH